jgi:carbonic anhydrase
MACEGEKGGLDVVNMKCPAVMVWCMDYRFRKYFPEFAEKKMGDFDPISLPGGVQSMNLQGKESVIFSGIKLAVAHHGAKHVWLFAHEDCGAYGGSSKFSDNQEAERQFHKEELKKAEFFLWNNLPGINIRIFYTKLRDGLAVFEEF